MSEVYVHDLMTICSVLLLTIGQNDINPKLLQSIVASICMVMTVKKPCVWHTKGYGFCGVIGKIHQIFMPKLAFSEDFLIYHKAVFVRVSINCMYFYFLQFFNSSSYKQFVYVLQVLFLSQLESHFLHFDHILS